MSGGIDLFRLANLSFEQFQNMIAPDIMKIGWPTVEDWLRNLAEQHRFDAIVGVSRSGLPLAVALSSLRPESSLAILSRRGPRGEKPPYYNFGTNREARAEALRSSFELTSLPDDASEVLIVDDVATYGDTLHVAAQKVRAQLPAVRISFACFAADEARLGGARPEILDQLSHEIAIDNSQVWVSFPWNLEPVIDKQ